MYVIPYMNSSTVTIFDYYVNTIHYNSYVNTIHYND